MKIPQRNAVSPIIATLLLIAITVAAGVVVYVFVGGLSASLSKSGGNQVTEQLSMDAYNFATLTAPALTVRNTGTGAFTISTVYYDGSTATVTCAPVAVGSALGVGITTTCTLTVAAATSGTSHAVKFVTSDGALFTFNVVAGSSG